LLVEVAGITAVAVGAVGYVRTVNEQKIGLLVRNCLLCCFSAACFIIKGKETECGNIMGKDNSVLIFCSSNVFGASAENDEILLFKNIAFIL
jgi:uncharacterized membrane protein YhiD involved in acid resistance